MLERTKQFLGQSRDELRKVEWPSQKEAVRLTLIVLAFSLFLAVYLGAFDLLFSFVLKTFVVRS